MTLIAIIGIVVALVLLRARKQDGKELGNSDGISV